MEMIKMWYKSESMQFPGTIWKKINAIIVVTTRGSARQSKMAFQSASFKFTLLIPLQVEGYGSG